MPLFKLLKGTEVRGSRRDRQVFKVGDVIESDNNLAAMEPERYERISDDQAQWYQGQPKAARTRDRELPEEQRPAVADETQRGPAPNRTSPATTTNPGAAAQAQTQTTTTTPHGQGAKPAAPGATAKPAAKNLEEEYGELGDLTVDELKEIATAEKVDLKGVTKKDDIVKALKAHK
jgi:hypothetical protein